MRCVQRAAWARAAAVVAACGALACTNTGGTSSSSSSGVATSSSSTGGTSSRGGASSFSLGTTSSNGGPCVEDALEPNDSAAMARTITLTGDHTVVDNLMTCAVMAWLPPGRDPRWGGTASSGGFSSSDAGSSSLAGSTSQDSSSAGSSLGGTSASPSSLGGSGSSVASSGSGSASSAGATSLAPTCTAASLAMQGSSSSGGGPMAPAATAGDDWYRVTLPPLTTLVALLEFTHANSDLDLVLVDPVTSTQLTASRSLTDTETARLLTRQPMARDVLLVVVNYGRKNNSYRLTLDTSTITPPANDTCTAATPLTPGTTVTGDTANSLNDLSLAYPSCGVYGTRGGDVFYGVTLAAGAQATFTLQSPADLALILMEDCAAPCCWASTDRFVANNTETLQFTNPTAAPLNLVLAVDGTQSGTFELHMESP